MRENGGSEEAVRARINAGWSKWKVYTGINNVRQANTKKLMVKIYKTVIRPRLLYGAEVWTMRKKKKRMLATTELKMLRRIEGITLEFITRVFIPSTDGTQIT